MFTPVTAHTAWTNYSMFTFSIVMTYLGCIGKKKKRKGKATVTAGAPVQTLVLPMHLQ